MRTSAPTSIHLRRRALAAAAAAVLVAALAACQPEPEGPVPSGTASSPSTSPSATPEPSPTATASSDDITLPASCDDIYSPAMRAQLDAEMPPLNDPGLTMPSTQDAAAMQVLDSGVPTLRCTWGYPSEVGIATNVSIVEPAATTEITESLMASGFTCADTQGGTLCRLDETLMGYDDNVAEKSESHFFRANGWVTTVWLNYDPGAYTEDIAAVVWE